MESERASTDSSRRGRRGWAVGVVVGLLLAGVVGVAGLTGQLPSPWRDATDAGVAEPVAQQTDAERAAAARRAALGADAGRAAARSAQQGAASVTDSAAAGAGPSVAGRAAGGRSPSEQDDADREAGLAIAGTVLDDAGRVLPGIAVSAQLVFAAPTEDGGAVSQGPMSEVSDELGMFRFGPLPEGEYDLAVAASEQYGAAWLRVRAGVESVELRLQRKGTIEVFGQVTDETTGAPLPGVRISALGGGRAQTSGQTGEYAIEAKLVKAGQPPVLLFQREGYRELRERIQEALNPGTSSVRVDVRLTPQGAKSLVTGVVMGIGGEPVAGASVWLNSYATRAFRRASTGQKGEYRIDGVETGDGYRVGVDSAGPYAAYVSEPFTLTPAGVQHDIVLDEQGESRLSGQVVDPSGRPLPGLTLWLRSVSFGGMQPLPVQTDASGQFAPMQVPSGQLSLETRSQPLLQVTGIDVKPGEDKRVVVPLDWGAHWLLGRVRDERGDPLPRARVVLQWSHGGIGTLRSSSRREVSTDNEGYFAFSNLGAGAHVLSVSAQGYGGFRSEYDPGGVQGEVEIALRRQPLAGTGG